MSDIRDILFPDDPGQPKDAYVSARSAMKKALPKRFYASVSVEAREGAFALLLDGKLARTPGRQPLALQVKAAADLLAEEWAAQQGVIDPGTMPATRIANVGIDRVEAVREAILDEIAQYAGTDLVCYRAEAPEGLVSRESAAWDPALDHARERHGARFLLAEGIGHVAQDAAAIAAVRAGFARLADPVALAAAQVLVTLAGSALIPLMLVDGAIDAEAAFDAASVDEDWNAQLWGEDTEALARRSYRRKEFLAAAGLVRALG